MALGHRIRQIRKERHMTTTDLAMAAGLSSKQIVNYECSYRQPRWPAAVAIAGALNVSLDWLYERTDWDDPPDPCCGAPLGARIRSARKLQGMSARDVQEICGVDQWTVLRIEREAITHSYASTIVLIANALSVSLDWLAGAEDDIWKNS